MSFCLIYEWFYSRAQNDKFRVNYTGLKRKETKMLELSIIHRRTVVEFLKKHFAIGSS